MAEPIWIAEQDVADLLDLPTAVDLVEAAFRAQRRGDLHDMEKTHVPWGGGHGLHAIGAADEASGLVATKSWAHTGGGATPILLLWDAADGGLRAVVEAFALGQLRTGAVSGVATRRMARADAAELAVIGSGRQALAQVAAVAAVRELTEIRLYSPTPANRDAFAERVDALGLGSKVRTTQTVEDAVSGAAVVTTVTRSREPFLHASFLAPGTHVNAVGAITPERRELAPDVVGRAAVVAADNPVAARNLAVELETAAEVVRLCDVTAGGEGSTRGDDLTVFKAMGVGLADLALGAAVLDRAAANRRGRPFPTPRRAAPRLRRDKEES
jgi:ornithine cyclodeaminase